MRKKRLFGIPTIILAVMLVLMLIGGGVLAAYSVFMGNATVTVEESITVTNTTGDGGQAFTGNAGNYAWNVSLYPGETKTLNVLVSNASSVSMLISTTGVGNEGVTADWSGPTDVPANSSITLTLTVTAETDTYPGARTIFLDIERG